MLFEWMDIWPNARDMNGLKQLLLAAGDGHEGVVNLVMVQLRRYICRGCRCQPWYGRHIWANTILAHGGPLL